MALDKRSIDIKLVKWTQSWMSNQTMWSGREDQDSICSDKCPFHYSAYRQEERGVDRHLVFLNGEHCGCCDSTLRNNHRLGRRFNLELAKYFKRTKVPEKWTHWPILNETVLSGMCVVIHCDWDYFWAEQLWFSIFLWLHEPRHSKSSTYWMSPSITVLSAALLTSWINHTATDIKRTDYKWIA